MKLDAIVREGLSGKWLQIAAGAILLMTMAAQSWATENPIYIDFGNALSPDPTEYNMIEPTTFGADTSLKGDGELFSNLTNILGGTTEVDLHVLVSSTGGDVRAGDNASTTHITLSGIASNALNDGLWCNNGTGTPATFGYTLTFSTVPAGLYKIVVAASSEATAGTQESTWTVGGAGHAISGTGGSASWEDVSPVDGSIVITGTTTVDYKYAGIQVRFASLSPMPPAGTVLIVR